MKSHTGQHTLSWPATRLGRWSVALAATFLVLFIIINSPVFMPSTTPYMGLRFYVIVMLLCGLAAEIGGLIAVMRQHERSLLVWLAIPYAAEPIV